MTPGPSAGGTASAKRCPQDTSEPTAPASDAGGGNSTTSRGGESAPEYPRVDQTFVTSRRRGLSSPHVTPDGVALPLTFHGSSDMAASPGMAAHNGAALESQVLDTLRAPGRLLYCETIAAILQRPRAEIERAVDSLWDQKLVRRNVCGQWSAYRAGRAS